MNQEGKGDSIKRSGWWCTPLIPAFGRQRQAGLCEFEVSLAYPASTKTGFKATQKNLSQKTKQNTNKKRVGALSEAEAVSLRPVWATL